MDAILESKDSLGSALGEGGAWSPGAFNLVNDSSLGVASVWFSSIDEPPPPLWAGESAPVAAKVLAVVVVVVVLVVVVELGGILAPC